MYSLLIKTLDGERFDFKATHDQVLQAEKALRDHSNIVINANNMKALIPYHAVSSVKVIPD